jgi:hypothetical protein
MNKLHTMNLIACCLHSFNFIAAIALYNHVDVFGTFKISLSTQFLTWDPDTEIATQDLVSVFDAPFVLWTSLFGLMSAYAHFAVLLNFKFYEAQLKSGLNHFRWLEYSVSSSLMMVLICMLFGIWDIFSLIFIASINAAMCWFGDMHERLNAGKPAD